MPPKEKYSDPKLRDEVKEEIQQSDKGGAPGQWSARKAQMMASEYKKRGGDYNTPKSEKDESQKNLDKWGEEDWQTKEGSGNAKKADGTEKRYLPKKAWENMSEKEKEETEQKKQAGSKQGKQFVPNTDKAKEERKEASGKSNGGQKGTGRSAKANGKEDDDQEDDEGEDDDDAEEDDDDDEEDYEEGDDDDDEDGEENEDDDQAEDDEGEDGDEDEEDEDDDDEGEAKDAGQKRKASQKSEQASKKQKQGSSNSKTGNAPKGTVGSKHMPDDEPAPRGSSDRLPKKGQKITWKAMPGYVEGKVTEVLTKGKTVDGKSVKASEDDPKIVMTSDKSGKVCVHKPEACFYD